MDLYGTDRGTISLPKRLQPSDKTENVIINTQIAFYNLKIAETVKRIQRLEERNKELEDNLNDTNRYIETLQEEEGQEIAILNSQISSHSARVKEYKKQLANLEKSRIDNKFVHTAKLRDIDEKYESTRLTLFSQLKFLNAKTNMLEDYKSKQYILEKKLDMQSHLLVREKEQVAEVLRQIDWKFKIDRKKLVQELYNCLVDLSGVFQLETSQHMPCTISRLLSENIAISNLLSKIAEDNTSKERAHVRYINAIKEYKRKINDTRHKAKRFTVTDKLTKSTTAMLQKIPKTSYITPKLIEPTYLTEEEYVTKRDNANLKARKCEARMKHMEILLYCEKEKLATAEYQKQQVSDQIEIHLRKFYDLKYRLTNLKARLFKN